MMRLDKFMWLYSYVTLFLFFELYYSILFYQFLNCFSFYNFLQEFVLNSRGLKLFACKWIPMNKEPKALVFICHGYGMECSITMNSEYLQKSAC